MNVWMNEDKLIGEATQMEYTSVCIYVSVSIQ